MVKAEAAESEVEVEAVADTAGKKTKTTKKTTRASTNEESSGGGSTGGSGGSDECNTSERTAVGVFANFHHRY
jgi:hypothetical protein